MAQHVNEKIYDWLDYHARYHGRDLAAVDLASGRQFTYAAFNDRVTRLATAFRDRYEVTRGDRVALLAQNSTDVFEVMFACWKLGAIFVPMNWRLHPAELAHLIDHCDPALVIHDESFTVNLADIPVTKLIRHDDAIVSAYEKAIADHAATAVMEGISQDTVHSIIYTSGTTGRPKGVVYNHRMTMNIVVHSTLHAALDHHSRTLTFAPLFHTAALNAGGTPLFHHGGTLYVMKEWNPAETLRLISDPEIGITHFNAVPTHFIMMSELPEFKHASFPTIKMFGIGSAPISMDLLETWLERGAVLTQSYGSTEAFCVSLTSTREDVARTQVGSAGRPMMHVEVRIADTHNQELPSGEVGEIQVRGPGITIGYYNEPGLTHAAFTEDGWYKTGDAAWQRDDGNLYIVDRIKDMFVSGGENIYPSEVEHVIAELPEVSQLAVIGTPHPKWGDACLAIIRLREGATLTAEDVITACRKRLAGYKIPKAVRFQEQLPLSPQGKILKKELVQYYRDHPIEWERDA